MKLLEISFDNIGIFEKGFNFDLIASDRVLDEDQVYNIYPELFISFLYKCGAPHNITIIAI